MRRSRLLLAFCLPSGICAAWTVFAGKDVNWDLLNYHYYLPYELLAGRLEQDFFAASAQSYLNPIGYLPFYLMVSAGWHSVVVSMVLAVAHALSISLLFLVAWELFAHLPTRERAIFSCLATAMGAATAVFWPTVGTSFLDPLLIPPMLAGLLLLLHADGHAVGRAALAGALFGAAAALKYSNAIFALAAFPLALAMPGLSASSRLRACLGYMAGGALGLAIFAGPWCALLMREFGNPVFPLMNAWFQSPHALAVNMVSERFTPRDLAEVLSFPFRMVGLDRHLYSETFAPDIRLAALFAAVVALPAVVFAGKARQENSLRGADWRVLAFFALGLVLWLASSTNARYGMVLLLLVGVCLARTTERILPARVARVTLSVLLLVQVGTSVLASPARWFLAEPWSKRWLPYDVPERALREPALYITVEMLSMAVVAPFVHPSSSFVNFRGQHSVPSDSPKLATLLERHRSRVRTLGRRLELVDGKPAPGEVMAYDASLRRIGYRVDASDCFTIAWRPNDEDALSRAANRLAAVSLSPEQLSVVSCALLPAARDPADMERERQASAFFDRIERRCPALFRGQTAVTEPFGSGWSRNYGGLDARLEAFGDRVALHRYRTATVLDLGRLSDWDSKDASVPAICGQSAREDK
jgi:hypothetical protein